MRASRTAVALGGLAVLWTGGAGADPLCAEAADPLDAGVAILRCPGVVIVEEADAVRSPVALMSVHPRAIQLDAGALAVSAPASAPALSALTPEVVVSGRDAEWIVAVDAGRTRVAVRRGAVVVFRREDGSEQTLRAGDAGLAGLQAKRIERLERALRASQTPP